MAAFIGADSGPFWWMKEGTFAPKKIKKHQFMSVSKLISNYASYNEWANYKLVNFLKSLEEELMYQKVNSSFENINQTLQHILLAQKFWLAFVLEKDVNAFNWQFQERQVAQTFEELQRVSTDMKTHFSAFTEAELLSLLELDMPWGKNKLSRYEYMMHVINHSTYHRGQIITMIRTLGINEGIINTDYNLYMAG